MCRCYVFSLSSESVCVCRLHTSLFSNICISFSIISVICFVFVNVCMHPVCISVLRVRFNNSLTRLLLKNPILLKECKLAYRSYFSYKHVFYCFCSCCVTVRPFEVKCSKTRNFHLHIVNNFMWRRYGVDFGKGFPLPYERNLLPRLHSFVTFGFSTGSPRFMT